MLKGTFWITSYAEGFMWPYRHYCGWRWNLGWFAIEFTEWKAM